MKILYFFLFLWVIFALLVPDPQFYADPDPATQINADPCGSGSGSATLLRSVPLSNGSGSGSYTLLVSDFQGAKRKYFFLVLFACYLLKVQLNHS